MIGMIALMIAMMMIAAVFPVMMAMKMIITILMQLMESTMLR